MDSPVIFCQIQTSPYSGIFFHGRLKLIQAHVNDFSKCFEVHIACLQAGLRRHVNRVPHQQLIGVRVTMHVVNTMAAYLPLH